MVANPTCLIENEVKLVACKIYTNVTLYTSVQRLLGDIPPAGLSDVQSLCEGYPLLMAIKPSPL